MTDSGTFCTKCGKLRNHPTMEDRTVTAFFKAEFFGGDEVGIFINHCLRCGHTIQVDADGDMEKEEFSDLDEYGEWLDDNGKIDFSEVVNRLGVEE